MIFISYRISDALETVRSLDVDLTREFGNSFVFRDKSRLEGGHDWTQELEQNAKNRAVMLVVIGATWQSATDDKDGDWKGVPRLWNPEDWVRKEISFALDADRIVIPVFLNGAAMPPQGWLANCKLDRLYKKQGIPFRTNDYDDDLPKLIALLRKICPGLPPKELVGTTVNVPKRLPIPPALYAVPNYILTSTFIGRATELDELDAWACSNDPLMVVEGIGGLGKSALTWEWLQKRAEYAIPDLAGRVWWSFYERGTSMKAFVHHALAYITQQDPDALSKESSHYERCQELLVELKRKPYLLVLDGFERVLAAYHRWDKAQQRDDKIEANLRECVEPRDGELLKQLLAGSPSKVILSTRLFPSILENRASGRPIVGVAHHHLNGLSRPDTLAFFKHAGIKGNEQAMLEFADQFGRHSLLLKVVCGEIAQYPRRPFNFDAWRADPIYGGKLQLSKLDLRQNYNHILHVALDGLEERKRKLLCRIAVLSENATYDTLAVLNPFLPPRPAEVKLPWNPESGYRWDRLTDTEKKGERESYRKALDAYKQYQELERAYIDSAAYQQAILSFDKTLKELQDRGLLQWDRESGHYDMHPVVRGHAAEYLEEGDRKQTFLTVRDHFASLPPDDLKKATDLSHVAHSVEIYRCLVGAGRLDDAANFYHGELGNTLMRHLGAHTLIVELLEPLFRGGQHGLPSLSSTWNQGFVLNELANAILELGREDEALELYGKAIQIFVQKESWGAAATCLRNVGQANRILNRQAEGAVAHSLMTELADAAADFHCANMAIFDQASIAMEQGQFTYGDRLITEFHAKPLPPVEHYRPGEAEYLTCFGQFSQKMLTESDWRRAYEIAVQHRNVISQYQFLALRSEWLLTQNLEKLALDAIDDALKIASRLGTPKPNYRDLRAWALAKLNRTADARAELANGEQRRTAAEAWLILGDRNQARTCALNGYRWAWGEGPPYIHWYELERSKAILKELGEPEPQLPAFDPNKVKPIPYEKEIRAAIAKLKAEKEAKKK